MFQTTDDLRVSTLRPLLPPAILSEELPVSDRASATVGAARAAARAVLEGEDDRLLAVVGPCSAHDPEAALDYAGRLKGCADRLSGELLIMMRVYFEKPRTTVGWKGLINDPELDGSFKINQGLRIARRLLLEIAELGLPAGTEFLDTVIPQFIAELVSWGAIGARTTESQIHRELASGLSMPVGFKNGTDGNVRIAADAVRAAQHPHHFIGVTKQGISAIVETKGNPDCHVILRGSDRGSNHDRASVEAAAAVLASTGCAARVMVDCSHGNSGKDPTRQPTVAKGVAEQIARGSQHVLGVMLESNLVAGRQDFVGGRPLTYGQSITDACLAWEETEPLLDALAGAVRARRAG